jgi:hypothetical protein
VENEIVEGGGGSSKTDYYYRCIVVATDVCLDFVRHLKRAFYTKHMAFSEEDAARPKKETVQRDECDLLGVLYGWWVDRSHFDPTGLSTSLCTSTQKNQNQPKSAIVA